MSPENPEVAPVTTAWTARTDVLRADGQADVACEWHL